MPSALLLAHVALALSPAGEIQTDPAAVVRASEALLKEARSVQGSFTVARQTGRPSRVQFVLEKPYLLSLRSTGRTEVFNGDEHVIVLDIDNTYETRDVNLYGAPYLIGFTDFFGNPPQREVKRPVFGEGRLISIGGRTFVRRTRGTSANSVSVDIDPQTKLPARWTTVSDGETTVAEFDGVRLNDPVPVGTFDIEGLKAGKTRVLPTEESGLIAVGSSAPSVVANTVQKRRLDLKEFAAKNRVTVVAFLDPNSQYASNGAAGLGNLLGPGNIKNVGVVAVVRSADAAGVRTLLKRFGREPVALSGAAASSAFQSFGVRLVPTFVVLDSTGTVTARMIGYNEDALIAAIAEPARR